MSGLEQLEPTSDADEPPSVDHLKAHPELAQGGGAGGPVKITGLDDITKLAPGTPFIIPSGPNKGKIGYAK